MGEMGLRAYRLSISWPRVLPERTGTVDQAGVDFYNRLVDTLLEQQIEPWVTLFHWDYLAALFDRGGWLNRDSIPETRSSADIDAARRATMSVTAQDVQNNTWFADPLFLGVYPSDALELYGERMPAIPDADMATIRQPLDFCGFNAYAGETIRATGDGGWTSVAMSTGAPLTTMGWQVTPDVLYWGCRFFHERYGRPVVITENGMANCDWI
jgi:beta-glucosidase/6-phospho-beta-glucosidase/beta-galactosidase